MKKLWFSIILLLVGQTYSFAFEKEIKELSANLAESISKSGKTSIAVVDFLNLKGEVTDGGRFFAEEFTVDLAKAGKGFKVIERNRLKVILDELKLASTGIIDEKTARKLGQIAGVDAIITGTATPLGDRIRLSVKMLAVDTAQVIAARSVTIVKTRDNVGIFNLFPVTSENPQPAGLSAAPPTTFATAKSRNFVFELQRCQREGSSLICDVVVTYVGRSKIRLSINSGINYQLPTRAADNSRQEYFAEMVQLGDQRATSGETKDQSMSPRDPVVASVVLKNIPSELTFLSLLEVGCCAYGGTPHTVYFVVQFRNVPIAQDELLRK